MLADDPRMRAEYERLGPRFETISRLIKARAREDVSQTELARRMNVRPNVISRLESGLHSPRLDTIAEYARALGYDLEIRTVKRRTAQRGRRSSATTARAKAKSRR
jgi:transcriptional regulator with XRE-family HTH domain